MTTQTGEPLLLLVTNPSTARLPMHELVPQAIKGGVDLVQIRAKALSAIEIEELVSNALCSVQDPGRLIVNGYPELASKYKIGLHLPEGDEWPPRLSSTERLMSRSVHSPSAAAASAGADFIVAGHVFETQSKLGVRPIGLEGLAEIVAVAPCRVVAIGGITPARIADVLDAGAAGVAAMSAINDAADPFAAAQQFRIALEG